MGNIQRISWPAPRSLAPLMLTEADYLHLTKKIERGEVEKFRTLLAAGYDPHYVRSDGVTLLMFAAYYNRIEIARLLIDRGVDLNALDVSGQSALGYAVSVNAVFSVELLIESGADISGKIHERSFLSYAALRGFDLVVKSLLDAGADHKFVSSSGFTILMSAIGKGHELIVKDLLERYPELAFIPTSKGKTTLETAIECQNYEIVRLLLDKAPLLLSEAKKSLPLRRAVCRESAAILSLLLERGAPITKEVFEDAVRGKHPKNIQLLLERGVPMPEDLLHGAASINKIEAAAVLLDCGAAVNSLDKGLFTPLYVAAYVGHIKMIDFLVERGADIDILGGQGCTALFGALFGNQAAAITRLLDLGANPLLGSYKKETLAKCALREQNTEVLKALAAAKVMDALFLEEVTHGSSLHIIRLLESGCDINMKAADGSTPLILAAAGGHKDVVYSLLEGGASLEEVNEAGETALIAAARSGTAVVVEMLLRKGASAKVATKSGVTAAMLAAADGHFTMFKKLAPHADLEAVDGSNNTALSHAIMHGHTAIAKLIIGRRRNGVNCLLTDGGTCLMLAVRYHNLEIVRELLEEGGFLNRQNNFGLTALMIAAQKGYSDIVASLIAEDDIELNSHSKTGKTALDYAKEESYTAIVDLLVAKGAESGPGGAA